MKKGCFDGHYPTDKKRTITNKFITVNKCEKIEDTKKLFPYAVKVLIFTLLLWTWEHFNKSATYRTSLGNKDVGGKESSMKGARCLKETESLFSDYYACTEKSGTSYFPLNSSDNIDKSDYSFSRLSEGKTKDYYEMTESDSSHSSLSYLSSLSEFLHNDNYEDPLKYNGIKLSNYKQKKHNCGIVSKRIRQILNFLSKMDQRIEKKLENMMKRNVENARTMRGKMSRKTRVKIFLTEIYICSPGIIGIMLSLICLLIREPVGCIVFSVITLFILFYIIIKIVKINITHKAYQNFYK